MCRVSESNGEQKQPGARIAHPDWATPELGLGSVFDPRLESPHTDDVVIVIRLGSDLAELSPYPMSTPTASCLAV